jgi:hypothetical protein
MLPSLLIPLGALAVSALLHRAAGAIGRKDS